MVETRTGTNRSAGPSYDEILEGDTRKVSEPLTRRSTKPGGNRYVPVEGYISREWHDLEVERLWKRTWQMACLEDEVRDVGDYYVYDIAHLSYLIVRSGPDEIKAFPNACPHKGTMLRDEPGKKARVLRCSYHGWSWGIDGTLKEVPCQWDFPNVDFDEMNMPEISVGTWMGFVFINPDPNAEPLSEFLGDIDDHFQFHNYANRYRIGYASRVHESNWKVGVEAFWEAYHVAATHPQVLDAAADACTNYDVFGNYSRLVMAAQVPSPHISTPLGQPDDAKFYAKMRHPISGFIFTRLESDEENRALVEVCDRDGNNVSVFDHLGRWQSGPMTQADVHMCHWIGGPTAPKLTKFKLPPRFSDLSRAEAAEEQREIERKRWQGAVDVDEVSDAEIIDNITFNIFPNLQISPAQNSVIRWRPHGDNPDECFQDVMRFEPCSDSENRPDPEPVTVLRADEEWDRAPHIAAITKIMQQDTFNMPRVQKGMKSLARGTVLLSAYQESLIRHFWDLLEAKLDQPNHSVQYPDNEQ